MPLDHISHVFRAIWKNYIFNTRKPNEKNQIVQSSFYLQFKSKMRLKSYILGLNFVSDLAHVLRPAIF